jgi:hypothetical protein
MQQRRLLDKRGRGRTLPAQVSATSAASREGHGSASRGTRDAGQQKLRRASRAWLLQKRGTATTQRAPGKRPRTRRITSSAAEWGSAGVSGCDAPVGVILRGFDPSGCMRYDARVPG